jgi:hypothetical protein
MNPAMYCQMAKGASTGGGIGNRIRLWAVSPANIMDKPLGKYEVFKQENYSFKQPR